MTDDRTEARQAEHAAEPLALRLNDLLGPTPNCPECNGTGERDSGGTHPWGEPIYLACDCNDAEVGRRWRADSSLKAWFPITAERLAALEDALRALADAADDVGVRHFDSDWLDDEVQAMKNATIRAREILGPNLNMERTPADR